jgi:hypothetical protein
MLLQKKSAKSLGAALTCEMSMARTSANYIGPFSTNSLIAMSWTPSQYETGNVTLFKMSLIIKVEMKTASFRAQKYLPLIGFSV